MSQDTIHARSLDSRDHPSRHWVKRLWGTVRANIPAGYKICGENVFAQHSIFYSRLPSYFLVFGVFDGNDNYLAWNEVEKLSTSLNLSTVPVLYRGLWNLIPLSCMYSGQSIYGGEQEGYVVRLAQTFGLADFGQSVAKFVRKNHVQTDDHWLNQKITRNGPAFPFHSW